MKRFKNILLMYDNRPQGMAAMERAFNLALDNEAHLKIVDVISRMPTDELLIVQSADAEALRDEIVNRKIREINQFISSFETKGLVTEVKVFVGDPFMEIVREVMRFDHDLVIKMARGRNVLESVGFGTTAMSLMRKCPCPVWIMQPADHLGYQNILAAVDPSPQDDERNRLNHVIMGLASSLAILERCRLHVVHAWRPPGLTVFGTTSGKIPRESFDRLAGETMWFHRTWTYDLVEHYASPVLESRIHLLEGDPAKIIPQSAREIKADLIVMGTVCRTGIAGFFIGNTAEKVLHQVDCSVMTVKPEGFVPPVQMEIK